MRSDVSGRSDCRYEEEDSNTAAGGNLKKPGLFLFQAKHRLYSQLLLNDVAAARGLPATSDGSFGGMFLFLGGG